MNYEIPKEIKSKPQIMGLEIRELVILLIGFLSIFTFLSDIVHRIFTIPFIILASLFLLWIVMPSSNNPKMKNYMSLLYFLKRDKQTYFAMDHHKGANKQLIQKMRGDDD